MTLFDPSELPPAPPDGASVRVRMTVAYHGKGFHGFAEQQGVKTVGGKLRQATERVLGHGIELACAGRTDTGVHARGQVVSFDADPERLDTEALERSLNKVLAPAVAVREVAVAPPDFDARRSAVARRYRYLVLNSPYPDPLLADRAWHVEHPLDLRALLGDERAIAVRDAFVCAAVSQPTEAEHRGEPTHQMSLEAVVSAQ